MPAFGDYLLCGIGTQLQHQVNGFDDIISTGDADYASSGLKATSLIRLGFLAVLPANQLLGAIGTISVERQQRLIERLATYLWKR